jgi:hypothetical protein
MLYFLDTEFNEFGGELISLALVNEGGDRELYVATDCAEPREWVKQNVLPIIHCPGAHANVIPPDQFGLAIAFFLQNDELPTIVADWPDDVRYFCEALITGPGEMVSIPFLQFQIIRVDAYPTNLRGAIQHNALWDARALRHVFKAALSRTARRAGQSRKGSRSQTRLKRNKR